MSTKPTQQPTKQQNNHEDDTLAHLFCDDQEDEDHATSRCGKTKSGWIWAPVEYPTCVVCLDMAGQDACSHCMKKQQP